MHRLPKVAAGQTQIRAESNSVRLLHAHDGCEQLACMRTEDRTSRRRGAVVHSVAHACVYEEVRHERGAMDMFFWDA